MQLQKIDILLLMERQEINSLALRYCVDFKGSKRAIAERSATPDYHLKDFQRTPRKKISCAN